MVRLVAHNVNNHNSQPSNALFNDENNGIDKK